MNVRLKVIWGAAAIAGLALAVACSSDSSGNPGSPSGGGGGVGGGTPPTATTTVTITSAGVSPKSITVPRGSQVTFVNSSSVNHEMASDPHPTHGSCPEIENSVGFITVGQSKQTGNLNTAGTCTYHDHQRNTDTSLMGSIIVQ
jgi:plastocyanin